MLFAVLCLRPMQQLRARVIQSVERAYMTLTVPPVTVRDGRGGKASSIVDGSYLSLVSDQNLRTTVIVGQA